MPIMENSSRPPEHLRKILALAGVSFNGNQPWDITVHDPVVYRRILAQGSLGFGEAYMDGLWDCPALDQLFDRLLSIESDIEKKLSNRVRFRIALSALYNWLRNLQSRRRAFQIAEQHYDPGQDVFAATLDPTMNYTCGYWEKAETLEQAQIDKMDMICRKLELRKGEIRLTDYRELTGTFDKIAVVGMFEHVGPKNYRTFFTKVEELLSRQGLFLLHTGYYKTSATSDPWITKYIFPNGKLPSAAHITRAMEEIFLIEDWHNFGRHYDSTLMAWAERFDRNWDSLKHRYNERFYRMWKYYLLCCAGMFRSGRGQLWQIVFSKRSGKQNYRSIRGFSRQAT
ncbi:MAG: class I SAM-dependent methyltransferase [Candidatus Electrothrix sp. YB6]